MTRASIPTVPNLWGFSATFFLSLARRFGDFCMLWYGSNPVVIINTPKAARDLLTEVLRTQTVEG